MPSRPVEGDGKLSLSERRQLNKLYGDGAAAYGSVKALVTASGLSTSKVKEFLHGKKAYTKYHLAVRNFPRLNVYAHHINEIWCMYLAHVDKLAKENGAIKYILVSVDIFSRFVRVQPFKDKTAKSTKQAFIKMLTTEVQPKKIWVDEGTEFEASFRSYCKAIDFSIYHTFSETKASYAERAIRSLKNIMYRYMEENDSFRYFHKLQSFAKTMNTRINRSISKAPVNVSNANAFSILFNSEPNSQKATFKAGDYVRISEKDIPFRKGYKPQFTDEIFKIIAVAASSPPTYTLQDREKEVIRGKFYEREVIKYTI